MYIGGGLRRSRAVRADVDLEAFAASSNYEQRGVPA